ncbi:LexA/Signal peptidase [Obba rivulosa]|uniref:Mitochondrial inner membrane protease subunit 2 n=1 Tax=Obba rivulosa TaxID=1052685 RepID=A0A8E2AX11_9APHY|nr:LexA/Signal peptidase [Obba rivulosa]
MRPILRRWQQAFASNNVLRRTVSTLIWLPTAIIFSEYCYSIKSIKGRSMQPTLNPDSSAWRDIVVFDRFSIRVMGRYRRGDIVALLSPSDSKLIVKRIIALEGDTVKTLPPYPDTEVRIPEGHAWVEGDEPFRSEDSNWFGPVPLALIDSRLSFIVWPWERVGPLWAPGLRSSQFKGSPAWRRGQAEMEREKRRESRVQYAERPPPKPPSDGAMSPLGGA